MMTHTLPLRFGKVEITLEDMFLAEGIRLIMESILCRYESAVKIVIFDASRYFDIVCHFSGAVAGIMVCENDAHTYLPAHPKVFRIRRSLSVYEMGNIISSIIDGKINSDTSSALTLNHKEINYIDLLRQDLNPGQISLHLGVNLKTVYALRQRLIDKLACSSFQEFHLLCKSHAFSQWLASQRFLLPIRAEQRLTCSHRSM